MISKSHLAAEARWNNDWLPAAMPVQIGDDLGQSLDREIGRALARVEFRKPEITASAPLATAARNASASPARATSSGVWGMVLA
jgi:hypothetical protein